MWNYTPESLAIRTRILSAGYLDQMVVPAAALVDALDNCCDAYEGDSVYSTLSDKLDTCAPEFIASLLTYGNIAPVVVYIQDQDWEDYGYFVGDVTLGNGHHRLAVLAHFDMPVKIMKTTSVHHPYAALPYGTGGVMADSANL